MAEAFQQRSFLLEDLRPGVSTGEAEADLTVVATRLSTVYPTEYPKHFSVQIESLTNLVLERFESCCFNSIGATFFCLQNGGLR